jgi:hypothetical protein
VQQRRRDFAPAPARNPPVMTENSPPSAAAAAFLAPEWGHVLGV